VIVAFAALSLNAQNASYDANSVPVNGYYCAALGYGALYTNTTGSNNTGNGYNALFANTTGSNNTAVGYNVLSANTKGSNNTAIGNNALLINTTGNNNTAFGHFAGMNSTGNRNVFIGNYAGYYESTGADKLYLANDSNKTILYGDFSTGQVLLGKQQPTGYTFKGTRTLNVLGGIITDSLRIAPGNQWADYVFSDTYQLMPLDKLDQYIQSNKHLPNIPSAKEVENNGIELGSINALLLEKIEELNLYIIQQQKQMNNQNKQIEEQNKSIGLLKEQMEAFKKSGNK
jgi:hypothetical protein